MMLKQFLNPPNWFTSASLFCGLYAIILAGQANGDPDYFYKAGLMVFFAGLFDALDGRVARMTGTGSQFGVQLDSLDPKTGTDVIGDPDPDAGVSIKYGLTSTLTLDVAANQAPGKYTGTWSITLNYF